MKIKEQSPISMAEVLEYAEKSENTEGIVTFINSFIKIKPAKAKELKEELKALDMLKLREEMIVKIIDFLPETAEDFIKVVNDTSFSQEEITKILEIIKKY